MITPLPFGGGVGGGATIFLTPVSLFHYVIMSQKTHLSPFVIMSLCLKKYICLPPSLCYSVLKTTPSVTPVLLCYPVFLTLSPPVLGSSVFQAEAGGEESGKPVPAHGEL